MNVNKLARRTGIVLDADQDVHMLSDFAVETG